MSGGDAATITSVTTEGHISVKDSAIPEETKQQSHLQVEQDVATPKKEIWARTKRGLILFALLLCMFCVSLNSTVVAPAMSIIATELDALENQTWIATAYMVAMNAFQPLSGKFSDIFGRKVMLLFGLSLFFVGSLINAVSPTVQGLIAGRAIQGFGAGGIMSILFIVITDIAPVVLRPRLQSLLVVIYGLASVVGPLIGGAFVDQLTWRWDFWLNLILSGLAFIILATLFSETATNMREGESFKEKIKRIDVFGTIFSIAFICCLLLALTWGPVYGWGNAHSIGPFVGAGVSFILLVISQGWLSKEPIIPWQVISNPGVFTIYIYMACLGLTFIGTLYFGPILFQSVFGANSTQSGIRLIPFMVCLIAGSLGSGFLLRAFPYVKFFIILGAASNLLGYGLFYTVNENSNWGRQAGFLTFCGFAFGLSQQNCILGVQTAAPREFMAVATGLNNYFMLLASSIGVAIYQTLFSTFLAAQFKGVDPQILAIAQENGALSNYLYIRNMPEDAQHPIIHAYMEALHNVFIIPIVAGAVGLIASMFIRNIRYGSPADAQQKKAPKDEEFVSESKE